MKRWKVVVGVMAVFALGVLAGGILTHGFYQKLILRVSKGPTEFRRVMVEHLSRQLDLTESQRVEADRIIREAQTEFQEIRKEVQPQVEDILKRAENEMRAQLDEKQRERFNKLIEKRKSRWHGFQAETTDGGRE